jgi:uncharacterized peroxidase-related enzyme
MNIYTKILLLSVPSLSLCMENRKPHIELSSENPGIVALFDFSPKTAKPMRELAHALLAKENATRTFSTGERELVAAYVSSLNGCNFCRKSHSAIATHQLGGDKTIVAAVLEDIVTAPIPNKMKALLRIAGRIQGGGPFAAYTYIEPAKAQGATDADIHDTVLIASAFCMFNRYVDGLNAPTPTDDTVYDARGRITAEQGYVHKTL